MDAYESHMNKIKATEVLPVQPITVNEELAAITDKQTVLEDRIKVQHLATGEFIEERVQVGVVSENPEESVSSESSPSSEDEHEHDKEIGSAEAERKPKKGVKRVKAKLANAFRKVFGVNKDEVHETHEKDLHRHSIATTHPHEHHEHRERRGSANNHDSVKINHEFSLPLTSQNLVEALDKEGLRSSRDPNLPILTQNRYETNPSLEHPTMDIGKLQDIEDHRRGSGDLQETSQFGIFASDKYAQPVQKLDSDIPILHTKDVADFTRLRRDSMERAHRVVHPVTPNPSLEDSLKEQVTPLLLEDAQKQAEEFSRTFHQIGDRRASVKTEETNQTQLDQPMDASISYEERLNMARRKWNLSPGDTTESERTSSYITSALESENSDTLTPEPGPSYVSSVSDRQFLSEDEFVAGVYPPSCGVPKIDAIAICGDHDDNEIPVMTVPEGTGEEVFVPGVYPRSRATPKIDCIVGMSLVERPTVMESSVAHTAEEERSDAILDAEVEGRDLEHSSQFRVALPSTLPDSMEQPIVESYTGTDFGTFSHPTQRPDLTIEKEREDRLLEESKQLRTVNSESEMVFNAQDTSPKPDFPYDEESSEQKGVLTKITESVAGMLGSVAGMFSSSKPAEDLRVTKPDDEFLPFEVKKMEEKSETVIEHIYDEPENKGLVDSMIDTVVNMFIGKEQIGVEEETVKKEEQAQAIPVERQQVLPVSGEFMTPPPQQTESMALRALERGQPVETLIEEKTVRTSTITMPSFPADEQIAYNGGRRGSRDI